MGNTVDRLLASRSGLVLPSSRVCLDLWPLEMPFLLLHLSVSLPTENRQSDVSSVVCFALLREVLQKHGGPFFLFRLPANREELLLVDTGLHLLRIWCRVFAFHMLTKQYFMICYLKSENRKCIS